MALAPPAATTTNAARKEIIRSVLDEITVLARGHSELVDLTLTWAGGPDQPHHFYRVRLTCNFLPDRGCRFVWVRMSAELADADVHNDPPLAFDLFPREVTEQRTYSRRFALTPRLAFAFAEIGGEASSESDVIRYEPRMEAAGLLTRSPTWTFTAPPRPGLVGSRELFMVLKATRHSRITMAFTVAAEAQTRLGTIPLRTYVDPTLVQTPHVLVPLQAESA